VISADGEFCNFTCLTEDSIKYLEKHGDLPIKYVKQRDVLSSSPNQLLNGSSKASNQAKANLLELKLRFISDVLDLWVQGDGLGCRPRHSTWPVWTGPKLDDAGGKKIDWVTVGRFGGDINESPVAPPLISV
jgi:myosin-1